MTRREELIVERRELIAKVQSIADGWGELARETDRKIKAWDHYGRKHGLTRPETRNYG